MHGTRRICLALTAALSITLGASGVRAEDQTFEAGSLIIPMDLAYQDSGMLQSYGLLFQLLRQGVTVYWVIDDAKTWHITDCDTVGDECAWDCAVEGSGVKCTYPTASPDFFVASTVLWDSEGGAAGTTISNHGYRGGPFVIDSADKAAAVAIVNAWNDQALWGANPFAQRTVFQVVSVHEATASFTGNVRKTMLAAPTIAVFSDGNEDIATSYLRAAGIPQSDGSEFPAGKCGNNDCGPGTINPDMLTVPSIMGPMGTCDAINYNHKNGSLFTSDGLPAFCQIMSMHWNVNDREDVQCDGGSCPNTQAECNGETITYHGHEVVAEVRQFLGYPTHFFAECQAVNAYENTVPNPDWPYLDDDDRRGHFLTTTGNPPSCGSGCTDGDFECVTGGCDDGTRDCCLPRDVKEKGAGFMIASQPNANTLQFLHPEVPYTQLDGFYSTVGGSEPAYNLSSYLDTKYINGRDVTFITGPAGPGADDLWMTGFVDGECDILGNDDVNIGGGTDCNGGKVSYLGGHKYKVDVPISTNTDSQGTRMFLNALFEADCVTSVGQPNIQLSLDGDLLIGAQTVPVERDYIASYINQGRGFALAAVLSELVGTEITVSAIADNGTAITNGAQWDVGSIASITPVAGDPPNMGGRGSTLSFSDYGQYSVDLQIDFKVGASVFQVTRAFAITVEQDSDGDTVADSIDPDPNDPFVCGDSDSDTCDDCAVAGMPDPSNDGPDADGDGICDAGEDVPPIGDDNGGCGCRVSSPSAGAMWLLAFVVLGLRRRRRRR